jgi:hypothetical protein
MFLPRHSNLFHLSSSHRYLKTRPGEKTPVEGLTGRQARAGETMENRSHASLLIRLRCFQAPVLPSGGFLWVLGFLRGP